MGNTNAANAAGGRYFRRWMGFSFMISHSCLSHAAGLFRIFIGHGDLAEGVKVSAALQGEKRILVEGRDGGPGRRRGLTGVRSGPCKGRGLRRSDRGCRGQSRILQFVRKFLQAVSKILRGLTSPRPRTGLLRKVVRRQLRLPRKLVAAVAEPSDHPRTKGNQRVPDFPSCCGRNLPDSTRHHELR